MAPTRRLRRLQAHLAGPAAASDLGPLSADQRQQRALDDGSFGASEAYPSWQTIGDLHLDHVVLGNEERGCPVVAKYRVGNFVNHPGAPTLSPAPCYPAVRPMVLRVPGGRGGL